MKINVDAAVRAFQQNLSARVFIRQDVRLMLSFNPRLNGKPNNWNIIARLVDNETGRWFLAFSSPFDLSPSRDACIRAAVVGLAAELERN